MTTFEADRRIEALLSAPQISYGFRFDLLEVRNLEGIFKIGEVHPTQPVTVSNDSSAAIKRSLQGVTLPPGEEVGINRYHHRLIPYVIMSDGSEWPLGVFMWADWGEARISSDVSSFNTGLVDQGLILSQPLASSFSIPVGENLVLAARRLMERSPTVFVNAYIEGTDAEATSPLTWPVSQSNTYAKVFSDIALLGGLYSPYFDNRGRFTLRHVPDLNSTTADMQLDEHIVMGSILEADDLIRAPNIYMVVNTSTTRVPIVGRYTVPSHFPHSVAQRGFEVVKIVESQSVSNELQARRMAEVYAAQDITASISVALSTPLDPRFDTFTIVSYGQLNYWERAWSTSLAAGATMSHSLYRILT